MASKCAQLVMLLLVTAAYFVVSDANKNFTNKPLNWNSGLNFTARWPGNRTNVLRKYSSPGFNFTVGWRPDIPRTSNKIIVGGDQKWQFGFNYTDWAMKNGPFFLNETLGTLSHICTT